MNAPIQCSDDVPHDPNHNHGYQSGREVSPAEIQAAARAAAPAPADLQTDAVRIPPQADRRPTPPQAHGAAAPGPTAAGDGRGVGNDDSVFIQGKDGYIKATGVASNLKPGVTLQIGLNNSMTVSHFKDGSRSTTSGTSSGISSGLNYIANKRPVTTSQAMPQERQLREICREMSGEWRRLGNHLHLKDATLDQVSIDYNALGLQEVIYQMLRKWTETCYPATMQALAKALVDIGRGDLADKLSN